MADEAQPLPAFAAALLKDDLSAKQALDLIHPVYAERQDSWQILVDAFEGEGGFLTGEYLWKYPAELPNEFANRQQQARYHNFLESLIDLYTRFLYTEDVARKSNSEELDAWLMDVDGQGTDMTGLMKRLLAMALVSGHAGVLVDKTPDAPAGPSKADETARVLASVFTALAIPDWRFSKDGLEAVKLIEAAPPVGIAEEVPTDKAAAQYLLWDTEGWARFDADGHLLGGDVPGLDMVPFVVLRPKPSYRDQMVGRPLIGNANVVRAMFNRCSEEDSVIRSSSFSMLTVSVGENGDIDKAREAIGNEVGATRALVTSGAIAYATPDQSVPEAIRNNIAYLVREMYRAAHVRFESDSAMRESGDAIKLNFTELNETLQGLGKALSLVEKQIVRCYFAWTAPTADAAEAAFEAAEFEASYPSEFFEADLMVQLEALAQAIRLNLGPTMTKRIKRGVVRRLDPDIPTQELEQIDKEIDGQSDEDLMATDPMVGIDKGDPEGQGIAEAANAAA